MKVLISRGYGAGWSTWNDPRMAFDERLIRAFECGITQEDMKELCVECGYTDIYGGPPYMGGFKGFNFTYCRNVNGYRFEEGEFC